MKLKTTFPALITLCLILFGPVFPVDNAPASLARPTAGTPDISFNNLQNSNVEFEPQVGNYNALLRVYVLEIVSPRWYDFTLAWYKHALLGYAVDTMLSIPYEGSVNITKTWNAGDFGYGDLAESNVMVVAALFHLDPHTAYSDPPTDNPFTAYWLDAAAEATPGNPGSDVAAGGYTHTVLVEKATRTGCSNCPVTAAVLDALYTSGEHNFIYISLVYQPNATAWDRVATDFNLAAVPTCYFDGGHSICIGGAYEESYYTIPMDAAGQREVVDADLDVSLAWLGGATVQVDVDITNNQYFNSPPEIPGTPAGPATGVSGSEYEFTTTSSDLDGHQIMYKWDWGDGQISDWLGPYGSGESVGAVHSFPAGDYDIKVKAKDDYGSGDESDWSTVSSISLVQRGEANGDGNINVGDAVFLINYVFKSGDAPVPLEMGDANCDLAVNVGDAVYIINYVFKSGNPPGCP